MLPAVQGTLWHSNGFDTVAAALHESTQNARMDREQGNAWILSPCGCHGDDFMAEGSDALLDRLDRVMADEFEAKMLGRAGRVKFLKRTIRWHDDEMCFSWSGGNRYVLELAVLLGLTDTRSVMMTRTPGDGWKRS